tara:strand:- start:693 stop:827 length:135 start_codon:yes stop_codon:yes gene_type:complete
MKELTRAYYSKLQSRFVSRDEYFDELLYSTIPEPFNTRINEEEI